MKEIQTYKVLIQDADGNRIGRTTVRSSNDCPALEDLENLIDTALKHRGFAPATAVSWVEHVTESMIDDDGMDENDPAVQALLPFDLIAKSKKLQK